MGVGDATTSLGRAAIRGPCPTKGGPHSSPKYRGGARVQSMQKWMKVLVLFLSRFGAIYIYIMVLVNVPLFERGFCRVPPSLSNFLVLSSLSPPSIMVLHCGWMIGFWDSGVL